MINLRVVSHGCKRAKYSLCNNANHTSASCICSFLLKQSITVLTLNEDCRPIKIYKTLLFLFIHQMYTQ